MSLKCALIVYHKNAEAIYPDEWIFKFRESIEKQTYKQFDIFELEYGGGNLMIFENSIYESKELPTFVDAMNYLLDKVFSMGYDYCMNSNADDYFALNRVEKQLEYMNKGFDIISSNFSLVRDYEVIHTHRFDKEDIKLQLSLNNNILCHPVICYSANYWKGNRYIPESIPYEDLLLWKRSIDNYKFVILEDVLCFHRLHSNSVCQSENR
jgi:hypothetical protein